ncbi:MAG: hypothetical protein MZV70_69370 [Desulfobacterales bacterium]|nr:hypothetical protein [Desulfobacterales bacterium]
MDRGYPPVSDRRARRPSRSGLSAFLLAAAALAGAADAAAAGPGTADEYRWGVAPGADLAALLEKPVVTEMEAEPWKDPESGETRIAGWSELHGVFEAPFDAVVRVLTDYEGQSRYSPRPLLRPDGVPGRRPGPGFPGGRRIHPGHQEQVPHRRGVRGGDPAGRGLRPGGPGSWTPRTGTSTSPSRPGTSCPCSSRGRPASTCGVSPARVSGRPSPAWPGPCAPSRPGR